MGCIVNGPGEAADADLAICAAKNKGYVYRHGRRIAMVPEDKIIELHGNSTYASCLDCGARYEIEPIREGMLIGDYQGLGSRWQQAVEGVL